MDSTIIISACAQMCVWFVIPSHIAGSRLTPVHRCFFLSEWGQSNLRQAGYWKSRKVRFSVLLFMRWLLKARQKLLLNRRPAAGGSWQISKLLLGICTQEHRRGLIGGCAKSVWAGSVSRWPWESKAFKKQNQALRKISLPLSFSPLKMWYWNTNY